MLVCSPLITLYRICSSLQSWSYELWKQFSPQTSCQIDVPLQLVKLQMLVCRSKYYPWSLLSSSTCHTHPRSTSAPRSALQRSCPFDSDRTRSVFPQACGISRSSQRQTEQLLDLQMRLRQPSGHFWLMLSLMMRKNFIWTSSSSTGAAALFMSCMGSCPSHLPSVRRQKPSKQAATMITIQILIHVELLSKSIIVSLPNIILIMKHLFPCLIYNFFSYNFLIFFRSHIILTQLKQIVSIGINNLLLNIKGIKFESLKLKFINSYQVIKYKKMGNILGRPEKIQISYTQFEQQIKVKLNSYPASATVQMRKENKLDYDKCIKNQKYFRALGCLFGCLIGDALGAFCEFQPEPLSQEMLDQTMDMKGGGVFGLRPGQFTDDTELAFHLLRGLTTLKVDQPFKNQYSNVLSNIAKQYVEWKNSSPFDIGITCKKGIEILAECKDSNQQIDINAALEKMKGATISSQSNGSLMRIAPMAIFFAIIGENPKEHMNFIKNEIALIHCNEVLQEAGYIWVKVLYDLIMRPNGDRQTYEYIYDNAKQMAENSQIKSWFKHVQQKFLMPAHQNMGWAKIAWTYGMGFLYSLKNNTENYYSYEKQIREVIGRGGDSDTNAAIVGGLLGAIVGFKGLPTAYLSTIFKLEFQDPPNLLIDRPKHYEPTNVLIELFKLKRIGENYQSRRKFQNLNAKQTQTKIEMTDRFNVNVKSPRSKI